MMVQIKLNNVWLDIEVSGSINFDRRIDEVFDSGSFSFISTIIDYNIPPLTLCKIDNKMWLCSSECNVVIPSSPKQYNHNVFLIELTYIATCYILGTKVFSNTGVYLSDNTKIQAIVDIINDKYKKIFNINAYQFNVVNLEDASSREYNFGPGITMFQSLLEISKAANAIPRINAFNENTNTFLIEWEYLGNGTNFKLDNSKIFEFKMYQNTEQYVSLLETEIESVEDNNFTSVKNLTVRSNDFLINSDNQILITPTRIKEVKSFRTSGIAFGKKVISGFFNYINKAAATPLIGKTQNMVSFIDIFTDRNYYNAVSYLAGGPYTLVKYESLGEFSVDGKANVKVTDIDITDRILEKSQYDLLPAIEQPKYCYYTYNSNLIEGMYKFYNDDFWSSVFMKTAKPFLFYAFENTIGTTNDQYDDKYGTTVVAGTILEGFVDYNPINYSFDIEYIPITSLFANSLGGKNSFNEIQIKPVVRSFNINTSLVDYDQLDKAINRTNKMMGMPEVTIGYFDNELPNPGQNIEIKDKVYYVSSIQTNKILDVYRSYINLVSDYSKIAEVYGVKTQFESTRLPLTGIVDRIVYCGSFMSTKTPTGALITVKSSGQKLYKRGVLFSKDNRETFIVEANDNYCFDTSMTSNDDLKGGNYENKQYTYADDNNEQESYTLQLVNENDLTIEESKALPIISDDKYSANYFNEIHDVVVHKDSRERLIFSFSLYGKASGGIDPEPDSGYSVLVYFERISGNNGVLGVGYNKDSQVEQILFEPSNSSGTFNNVTKILFTFAGPGGSFKIGTIKDGNDIYSGGAKATISIEKNTTLYVTQTK